MFLKKLEPFQLLGATRLACNYHYLLADVPGLGKTLQAIQATQMIGAERVLVVCPASVRSNWKKEIGECLNFGDTLGWVVISYDQARKFVEYGPPGLKYDVIILDEGHFLKTPEAQRTKAIFNNVNGLARLAKYKWVLTGTPVLNRPRELFPVLKTLHPHFANMTFATFAQRYCGAYYDGFGINTKGATNIEELAGLLSTFMLRRTKQEAFPGRIEPQISLTPIDVTAADLAAVRDEEDLIMNRESYISVTHEKFGQLGDLARLLRLTGEAKVRATCAYLEDMLETIDKVVVFFHHTEVGKRLFVTLAERGYCPVIYQGGMSDQAKDEARGQFMNVAARRVFLGQIQAAGTGINGLQEVCSDVVFAEQSWVPGAMGQAIDRLDRMGRVSDFVSARILHAPGTLESAVLGSRDGKSFVISRLMGDAKRVASVTDFA